MITTINEFKKFLNENFHGSNTEPEIIKDGERDIVNYTGVLIKKNENGNWAAYPKEGDAVFVLQSTSGGFSSTALIYMKVFELDKKNNVVICDNNGVEMPVKFKMTGAGHRVENDDMIAFFEAV